MTFENELGWILTEFKDGKSNFREVTLRIEELIVRCLGLNLYMSVTITRARNDMIVNNLLKEEDK
jgi:hypothetical protein